MNGFIGIKTNWYTKVKKTHVSKQLNYITYKIRLYTTYKTYTIFQGIVNVHIYSLIIIATQRKLSA